MKKGLMFFFCVVFLISSVSSQGNKIEISLISEDNIILPGEAFQIKVNLYDSNNKLVNDKLLIILKNLKNETLEEAEIQSNITEEIKLPDNIFSGEAKIIARYKDIEDAEIFFIGKNNLIEFKINEERLIITNIGNSVYNEQIYITIGETTGTKTPHLEIGESVSYRLIAPEGVYNVKVSDGKTTVTQGGIKLTGTGKAIGALDESASERTKITGGVSPDEESEVALMSYIKNSKFTYVFIFAILGAMILLAIEKRYKNKLINN